MVPQASSCVILKASLKTIRTIQIISISQSPRIFRPSPWTTGPSVTRSRFWFSWACLKILKSYHRIYLLKPAISFLIFLDSLSINWIYKSLIFTHWRHLFEEWGGALSCYSLRTRLFKLTISPFRSSHLGSCPIQRAGKDDTNKNAKTENHQSVRSKQNFLQSVSLT